MTFFLKYRPLIAKVAKATGSDWGVAVARFRSDLMEGGTANCAPAVISDEVRTEYKALNVPGEAAAYQEFSDAYTAAFRANGCGWIVGEDFPADPDAIAEPEVAAE